MGFPTVAARAVGRTSTTNTTSHPITLPAGIVAGDLLVVFFSATGVPVITHPADWFRYDYYDAAGTVTGGFWYKWASGGDTLTLITDSPLQSSHISYRITNGGVPSAAHVQTTTASTNTNPATAFTFQNDDYLVLISRHGAGTTVATAVGGSFTNLQTEAAAGSGGASTNTAERNVTITTGSIDPAAFTSGSAQSVAWTVLIPSSITVTQTVLDAFPSGGVDTGKWDIFQDTGTNLNTSSNVLNLITPTGSGGYVGVTWLAPFSLQPGQIYGTKLVSWSNDFDSGGAGFVGASVESYPIQIYPNAITSALAGFLWHQGQIESDYSADGITRASQTGLNDPPISALWFGVGRYTNGDLMWCYSSDGIHWRRYVSIAWPGAWDVNDLSITIVHGQYDVESGGDIMLVDNFMLGSVVGSVPTAHVRRSGTTVVATGTKVRRSGAWVTPTAVKVRRSGAWVTPT